MMWDTAVTMAEEEADAIEAEATEEEKDMEAGPVGTRSSRRLANLPVVVEDDQPSETKDESRGATDEVDEVRGAREGTVGEVSESTAAKPKKPNRLLREIGDYNAAAAGVRLAVLANISRV